MSGKALEVTDGNFETTILNADKPALVDFWAVWCVDRAASSVRSSRRLPRSTTGERSSPSWTWTPTGIPPSNKTVSRPYLPCC